MEIPIEMTPNSLTKEPSWTVLVKPYSVTEFDTLVNAVVAANPTYTPDLVASVIELTFDAIKAELVKGNSVNIAGACSFRLTIPGRYDATTDPVLPSSIEVAVNVSTPWREAIRSEATITKLPVTQKAPLIESVTDAATGRLNYAVDGGLTRLAGSLMKYPEETGFGVVFHNTVEDTEEYCSVVGENTNTKIIALPVVEKLDGVPESNEYTVRVETRYTLNGTRRVGTYSKYVRTPRTVTIAGDYPLGVFISVDQE